MVPNEAAAFQGTGSLCFQDLGVGWHLVGIGLILNILRRSETEHPIPVVVIKIDLRDSARLNGLEEVIEHDVILGSDRSGLEI